MMRKISAFFIAFSFFIVGNLFFNSESTASAIENKSTIQIDELKLELKETFPEYAEYLEFLDDKNYVFSKSMPNIMSNEDPKVIFSETREYDEDTEYSLTLFDNGTYATVQSWIGNAYWSGGTSSTGSGYVSYYNRQLTVWYNLAKFPMTLPGISYTNVNGGYDSFIDPGYGFINGVGISAYPYKKNENSSGPAYAYFTGENEFLLSDVVVDMQVKIEVGSDTVGVFLQGTRLY